MNIPALTAGQMREVDRLMIEEYHIELIQMMENAGRHLAALARRRFLDGDPRERAVLVLAGRGGNGGGGLVAARRLHNWGARVRILVTHSPETYGGVPGHQLDILSRMQVPVDLGEAVGSLPPADVILDALIGYSLRGAPTGPVAQLIRLANECATPVLSLDVPLGVDAATGTVFDPHICTAATLTLALPKTGLLAEVARPSVGELYLADIGVPPQLYAALGLEIGPVFAGEEIVRLL